MYSQWTLMLFNGQLRNKHPTRVFTPPRPSPSPKKNILCQMDPRNLDTPPHLLCLRNVYQWTFFNGAPRVPRAQWSKLTKCFNDPMGMMVKQHQGALRSFLQILSKLNVYMPWAHWFTCVLPHNFVGAWLGSIFNYKSIHPIIGVAK